MNYSYLPGRARRIIKNYEYCISGVTKNGMEVVIHLKVGFKSADGSTSKAVDSSDDVLYFLKSVTKPAIRKSAVALFGFNCPICKNYISKGSNYVDLNGLRICNMCNVSSN